MAQAHYTGTLYIAQLEFPNTLYQYRKLVQCTCFLRPFSTSVHYIYTLHLVIYAGPMGQYTMVQHSNHLLPGDISLVRYTIKICWNTVLDDALHWRIIPLRLYFYIIIWHCTDSPSKYTTRWCTFFSYFIYYLINCMLKSGYAYFYVQTQHHSAYLGQ